MTRRTLFGTVFLLGSCTAHRMLPQERFLSLRQGEDKIVVASVIPHDDSTGTYMSMLVFVQAGGQAVASVECLTPDPHRNTRRDFFAEGLVYSDPAVFPVAIRGDSLTPASERFGLRLDRKFLDLYGGSGSSHYACRIRFDEQLPFPTQSPQTDFGIGGLEPVDAVIDHIRDGAGEVMNGRRIRKPSVLLYHTLENGNLLLASPEKTYYWIDFRKIDGMTYSVFFAADASGAVNVLYSTLASGDQLTAHLYYTADNTGISVIGLRSVASAESLMFVPTDENPLPVYRKGHTVRTVIVTENNRQTGSGIVYQL